MLDSDPDDLQGAAISQSHPEFNQQEELIDRLAEGEYGSMPGEVIGTLFHRFRLEHREVLEEVRSTTAFNSDRAVLIEHVMEPGTKQAVPVRR